MRDGQADVVDCGAGTDTVTADRADTLTGCENVKLPPPATGKVTGPARVAKGAKATFGFTSPVVGARFQCKLDGGAFTGCRSPYHLATSTLAKGVHTLRVRAVQPVGNADPTPSVKSFRVV